MADMKCQIVCQEKILRRKIIVIGKINSADDKPNQIPLSALPLRLLKYLDIVVDDV